MDHALWSGVMNKQRQLRLQLLCTECLPSMHSEGCQPNMHGIQAIDKDTEKAMLAYFFKKQEEQKVSA